MAMGCSLQGWASPGERGGTAAGLQGAPVPALPALLPWEVPPSPCTFWAAQTTLSPDAAVLSSKQSCAVWDKGTLHTCTATRCHSYHWFLI